MKKNRPAEDSLLALLVRNYIWLTIAVGMLALVLVGYYNYHISHINMLPDTDQLALYEKDLQEGRYDEINVEKVLGTRGFFEILDEECEFLYSSNKDYLIEFTVNEVNYIESVRNHVSVEVAPCVDDSDDLYYVVTRTFYTRNGDIENSQYLVLDGEYRVKQGIWQGNRERLTKREFDVLCQRVLDHYSVTKYTFLPTNKEKNYTMVLFSYVATDEEISRAYRLVSYLAYVSLGIYIVFVSFFIWWTYRNVKRPLQLLNEAIVNYETGKVPEVAYEGHQEFVTLFDSFRQMAYRLTKSEKVKHELEQQRSQMLANISHDLKTPITVISGYSKALCDGMIPDDEKWVYFDAIYQKSSHLSNLITAFSEYSRLEHPEFKLNVKSVDICEMVRAYLANKYGELEIEGFLLETEIPEEQVYCMLDEFQFARVMENIIGNCIRYNEAGITIYVTVETSLEEGIVILSIGDNGSGIPEVYREKIFEPFVVGNEVRGTDHGSGLGLAIVKKIITAHGGSVQIMQHPRGGLHTEFVITLPMADKTAIRQS